MLIRDLRNAFNLPAVDERDVYRLAGELTVHPAFARVLIARGISDARTAHAFLNPTASDLGDPADFPGVAETAETILSAVESGGRIFIAGDFDVDGLTGTALLVRTIRALGGDVDYYIPNRLVEGYDLSEKTVKLAAEKRTSLLVTVDCGTRAVGPVTLAKELGMDVIVTDHHRPAETRPPARLVTPYDLPEKHPAKHLSGAGIAYKVSARLLALKPTDSLQDEDLLPLVALGTVCDVVPLTGENRTLARLGIENFSKTPFPGLQAIMDTARVTDVNINSWHLAFVLGPRLNAAGRLGRAETAAELLTTDDPGTAYRTALLLEEFNYKRRELENSILDDVKAAVGSETPTGQMAIVTAAEDWHAGVIGIVASRIVELYNRPTVLVSFSGDTGRGSCRSVPAFDIHRALETTDDLLIRFGGHHQAAGFEIRKEDYAEFEERFLAYAGKTLSPADLVSEVYIDTWMSLAETDVALPKSLALLEPAGTDNPPPVMVSLAEIKPESRRVYKEAHLGFTARLGPVNVRSIAFRMADDYNLAEPGYYLLYHTPNLNVWEGAEKTELRVTDIKPVDITGLTSLISDRRNAQPEEVIADESGPETAVFSYSTSPATFPNVVTPLDEKPGPVPDKCFDKLVFYEPPFSFSLFKSLISSVKARGAIVFAFGPTQIETAKEAAASMYPDKKTLKEIYRVLKCNPNVEEAKKSFHPAGFTRALTIFRELELVELEGESVLLNEKDDIQRLETSATFNRSAELRSASLNFIQKLTAWPTDKLNELAFSAINLDNPTDVS
jgi:single-stranded-DNA-specific exonuclease